MNIEKAIFYFGDIKYFNFDDIDGFMRKYNVNTIGKLDAYDNFLRVFKYWHFYKKNNNFKLENEVHIAYIKFPDCFDEDSNNLVNHLTYLKGKKEKLKFYLKHLLI